ncbi:MAG: FAD-binding protein [Gammaproteobacteria bacterium]|jgi:electron transfer flavoprotein alpha subunit
MTNVLVIAEHDETALLPATLKTIGAANDLAGNGVDVAVLAGDGDRVSAQAACIAGVSRVLKVDRPENAPYLAAVWAPQVAMLAGEYSHVLAPATTFGKDLLPRAAAVNGTGALSDVTAFEGPYRFQRPVYAGNAVASVESSDSTRTVYATVRTTAFEAPGEQAPATIDSLTLAVELPTHTRFIERRSERQTGPDLQSAATVVAGGRGIGGPEGVDLIQRLAEALNAAVGASRAAVDAGWMSNDLQVGQTGKIIAPGLYIGIGVSGAIQHLTGIKDAGTIVAINNDAEAPICAIADIALIGDLFTAVPDLIEQLESRRQN